MSQLLRHLLAKIFSSLLIVSANLLPIPTIIKQRLHVCSEPGEVGSLQLTVHHNTEVNSNSGLTSSILKHNIFAIKYLLTAFKSECTLHWQYLKWYIMNFKYSDPKEIQAQKMHYMQIQDKLTETLKYSRCALLFLHSEKTKSTNIKYGNK